MFIKRPSGVNGQHELVFGGHRTPETWTFYKQLLFVPTVLFVDWLVMNQFAIWQHVLTSQIYSFVTLGGYKHPNQN